MVDRDRDLNAALSAEERHNRLRRKNAYNFMTAMLFLASRWMFFFAGLVAWQVALLAYPQYGVFALFAAGMVVSTAAILFFSFLERASLGFKRLAPQLVTIYEPYFWWHERHWKLSDSPIMQFFPGTPMKNLILWLAGVKIGRKVYDANCSITDRSLTEIGDYANLNEGSVLQAHSLEEGVFKSDSIRMGKGCTLGPAAFVHYGVTLGDHVVIDADSFLMKGEVVESHTAWRGNPAKLSRRNAASENKASVDSSAMESVEPYAYNVAAE
jgi:non-ribosomal peptide synthetase-like protein